LARVRCHFLGARPLVEGDRSGIVKFPKGTDKHTLADLEGKCWLTNDPENPDQQKLALLSDINAKLEWFKDFIEKQTKGDTEIE
jgi:hypothetical protein